MVGKVDVVVVALAACVNGVDLDVWLLARVWFALSLYDIYIHISAILATFTLWVATDSFIPQPGKLSFLAFQDTFVSGLPNLVYEDLVLLER